MASGKRDERHEPDAASEASAAPPDSRSTSHVQDDRPSSRASWRERPLAIVVLYACAIGAATAAVLAAGLPGALLVFLAVPVLFAPLVWPRWVFLSMTLTVCAAVGAASLELPRRPVLSLFMSAGMLLAMVIVTEFVRLAALRRTEADETSARSDDFYRTIIDQGSDLVSVIDLQGNTPYRSSAHGRLLGWRDDEHRTHAQSGLHPDDLAAASRATAEALKRPGEPMPIEGRLRHADGSWRHVEGTITNRLDSPSVAGLVVAVRDVTDRRDALRALAVSEANLRTAQRIAQLGSWDWLPDEDRVIWSDHAARIFGFDPAVQRVTFADIIAIFVHPDDRSRLSKRMDGSLRDSSRSELTYRIIRRDGEVRWIRSIARVSAVRDGRARKISGTVQDVTNQRLAEIELERHRNHLQELVEERTRELDGSHAALERSERLASLGTLAAGMAHQINNPVGAILLGAEYGLQLAAEAPESDPELVDALRDIANEAVRCRRIVRSVLKFSRNESSERWEADLRDAIERAGDAVRVQAQQHGAKLMIARMPERLPVVMNPIEIEQVLVNLIHNAMQAGPRGVSIQISARRLGSRVRVEIRDDGHGIDAADLEHVFEPFFTTRLGEGGTGLGLSVAHGISHDHGGLLEIESAPGDGTRVSLELPLAGSERPARPSAQVDSPQPDSSSA